MCGRNIIITSVSHLFKRTFRFELKRSLNTNVSQNFAKFYIFTKWYFCKGELGRYTCRSTASTYNVRQEQEKDPLFFYLGRWEPLTLV